MATEAPVVVSDLVLRTETRRQRSSAALDPKARARLGQYFTPAAVAEFMASLPQISSSEPIRVLDPGAGTGSLAASLVMRILRERPGALIHLTACEVDPRLHPALEASLDDCVSTAREYGSRLETSLVKSDFIEWATENVGLFSKGCPSFDIVIMNPPYKKLASNSRERRSVAAVCAETSNLYSAFMALGVHLLRPEGQLVTITPRSFANGPYFRAFRRYFLGQMHIDHMHVFEARNKVFMDAEVLQENVILSATRNDSSSRGRVVVSTSFSDSDRVSRRSVPYEEIVYPEDPECFIHISTDEDDTQLAATYSGLPSTLADLGFQVSTGRVVDFRNKKHLRLNPIDNSVPLIYPLHMRDGGIRWPALGAKKNNAIILNEETEKLMFPRGFYVVVKRLSSKEEKRRVVASVFDPDQIPFSQIGFENHVNVFHHKGGGLRREVAYGLCFWLNSTLVDRFVRRFNGHTQVNATDLRSLRYPSPEQLSAMGRFWVDSIWPSQEEIDEIIDLNVSGAAGKI